jgi:multiple sugar transport system permease protein
VAIQRRAVDKVASGARYLVLVVGAVLFLVPFYLLLRNGLSTESDITSPDWTLFPSSLQWGNIAELFDSRSVPMARLWPTVQSSRSPRRCWSSW